MSALELVPVVGRVLSRMKQPTKDAYRQWLNQANDRIAELEQQLRVQAARPAHMTAGLLTDLIEAAQALGHHETLRSSSDDTITYWRGRVASLRAELEGDQS